ncbi:MAG: hypothetical protein GC138_06145 [Gammaproteobacteria bacterium]|nr:hypothetical protein [Gammaproteobacteria bacterium]
MSNGPSNGTNSRYSLNDLGSRVNHSIHNRFFFIGPDKSGSTWIHKVLTWHPQVYVAPSKELEFFNRYYDRGIGWYERYFKDVSPAHRAVGEVEHDYLFSVDAAERIHAHYPDAKLLVCMREPAERAFSAYLYMIRQGRVSGTFEEALDKMPELVDHGRYEKHLLPFIERFGDERIFPGVFDDLKNDPDDFARRMFEFLGVDELPLPETMQEKALAAAKPRSVRMASLAKRGALLSRAFGLPRLVTWVKNRAWVNNALYREYADDRPVADPDTLWRIRAELRSEIAAIDHRFGLDLTARWRYEEGV